MSGTGVRYSASWTLPNLLYSSIMNAHLSHQREESSRLSMLRRLLRLQGK